MAQKANDRWPAIFWGLSLLAVLLLTMVAGCRDFSVGTDIHVYGLDTFNTAKSSLDDFWGGFQRTRREFLFYAINYVAACFSDSLNASLFLQSLIIHLFALSGMKRYMGIAPLWCSMLMFELYFYAIMLNMMAQGIACVFLFWSLKFLEERKLKQLMLCMFVCFFFHKTSLFAYCALLFFYWVLGKDVKRQSKYLLFLAIGCATTVALFAVLMKLLTNIPAFAIYQAYANGFFSGLSPLDVGLRFFFLGILLALHYKCSLRTDLFNYTMLFLIVDICAQFLGLYVFFTTRFGLYFFLCEIPLFLASIKSSQATIATKYILNTTTIILFICYCVKSYYINNWHDTYPYKSEILDI